MFVTVNGARLRVDVQGEGPTIIAHHGAPGLGTHATPKRAFAPLADAYRIVTFDARGSGESDATPPYTHAQWVADVDALRAHLGVDRFVMKGGSYGGYVALEYTLAHPERVSHLILRDTSASRRFEAMARRNALARAAEFPDITEDLLDMLFEGRVPDDETMRSAYATIAPLYDANTDPQKAAERVASAIFRADTHNQAFAGNLPSYDLTDRLHEIQAPTLIVVGRHDWITPVAASEEIAAGIPNAELVIFEHSGHSPQLEENERFVAVVRDFLARHGAGGAS
ncbi:MAG: alpha/beta hydrolase [Trueperaceae bacterium]|nr:MAG: alpha/beta hydrolase [Trueperaceae bacterium]